MALKDNPANSITTKFVRTSTNKMRCPIFCVLWTPEGRRLVTGASSGEFTLWNGLTFNFETILQVSETTFHLYFASINTVFVLAGSRHLGEVDGVVAQRSLDGDRGPDGLREVLAKQHEQCQDVPGS